MLNYQPLTVPQLFQGMPAESFESWCTRWVSVTFPAETVLYKPYQRGQTLYLLSHGRVTLYHLRQGEKQIICTLGAGAIFGRMPLVGQLLPDCFAATAAETELFILSRAAVEQLIRQQPEIALHLLPKMGTTLAQQKL